jgi:hypothetical protein
MVITGSAASQQARTPPVDANGARSAHLGAAEPSVGEIGRFVLGDPIEHVEDPHPFLIRHLEVLVGSLFGGPVEPTNPHREIVARCKSQIAGG